MANDVELKDLSSSFQIGELRQKLFETLKGLTDKKNPMDLARAKAVANVSQVILNSVKVEYWLMRMASTPKALNAPPAKQIGKD